MKKVIIKLLKNFSTIFHIVPVKKKKIIFISFYNKYTLDIKAFGDFLIDNHKDEFECYIGTIGRTNLKVKNMKTINIRSINGIYHLSTAQIIVCGIHAPDYIKYRENQIIINTWHGNGIKKADVNPHYFDSTTCFLSYSEKYTQNKLKNSFGYDGFILPIGLPKNDIFFNENKERIKNEIKAKLGINEEKIVLFAPTFRSNFKNGDINLNFDSLIKQLNNSWKGEWIGMYRAHPSLTSTHAPEEKALDVTKYDNMQELLLISDILITDYSSSVWDFGLQGKPVIIFAPDIDEYSKNDRGFIIPVEQWPYPIAKNNEELSDIIKNYNYETETNKIIAYNKSCNSYDCGHASEKLYEYIYNEMEKIYEKI